MLPEEAMVVFVFMKILGRQNGRQEPCGVATTTSGAVSPKSTARVARAISGAKHAYTDLTVTWTAMAS